MSALIPSNWLKDAAAEFAQLINRPIGFDPSNLPNNYTPTKRTRDWLNARRGFTKRWNAIVKEGFGSEFLEWGHCYECGGMAAVTTATTYDVATPNPDYIPPAPLVGNSVTIPRAQKGTK